MPRFMLLRGVGRAAARAEAGTRLGSLLAATRSLLHRPHQSKRPRCGRKRGSPGAMSTYGGTTSNGEKTYEDQPPQPMEISTDFEAHGGTLEMPVRCIRDGKPRAVLLAAALCGIAVVLTVAYRATASRVTGGCVQFQRYPVGVLSSRVGLGFLYVTLGPQHS